MALDHLSDPTFYRSIVGTMQYDTITRPEISFAMNKACQFLSQPLEGHNCSKKNPLILKRIHTPCQLLKPASILMPLSLSIEAFSDIDWGSDPDDRKSTSESCLYLGPNLVSRWS